MALPALDTPPPAPLRRGRPLRPGDRIALVAPSRPADPELVRASVSYLERRGYEVQLGEHIFDAHHYLAGSDQDRATDLMAAFADPDVVAVFCARGGYGSSRILPLLDYQLLARNAKILIGFSDTTALLLALYRRIGLVCFTGALADFDLSSPALDPLLESSLWRCLTSCSPLGRLPVESTELQVLCHGRATGPLIPANLALLCSLLGSPYAPDLRGAIILLEDVGEYPYRIDRMLNQLRLAGILAAAGGLVFGPFRDCFTPQEMEHSPTLEQMLVELTDGLDIPIVTGFPHGHLPRRLVLPIGVIASLDTAGPHLSIEAAALAC
jgi:muramoyltetrapeptide carboxypeptidase